MNVPALLLRTFGFVAFPGCLCAQESLLLRVVDLDGVPIPYAMVTAQGGTRSADTTGRVRLNSERSLTLTVAVRRMGYVPFDGPVARLSYDDDFAVVLQPIQRAMDTVRTIAPRQTPLSRTGFYDRMERAKKGAIVGEFITPEELELRARGGVTGVFWGKQYARPNGEDELIGRRNCKMQILLDGMLIAQNDKLKQFLAINEVMGIEIYPSTANAPHELIPVTFRGSCGIVAFWTGPRR